MRPTTGPTIALILALTSQVSAQAPKADKLDVDAPRVVRTIPITRNGFDDRWFGPPPSERWLSNQPPPSDRFTPEATRPPPMAQNVSTALPEAVGIVPVPGNRLRHDPITATPKPRPRPVRVADICTKHGKTKVFTGKWQWRCK